MIKTYIPQIAYTSRVALLAVSFFACSISLAFAATTATLLPTGEGTNLAWTPSTGTTHYTLVDESSCNGTTDYVSETTVGDRDSYVISLATIPDNATITTIAVSPCASRNTTGGGSATLNVFYRFNGNASSDVGAYALANTNIPATLATTNFGSLSLVKKSTSTLQVGVVYSAGTKGARLSRMATVITYTPATPNAPTSLIANATTSVAQVFLRWTDNSSNETGFKIERRLYNTGSYVQIATTTVNVISYTDTSVPDGRYQYQVRAYNAVGNSSYTAIPSPVAVVLNVPLAPFSASAFASSSKAFVSWQNTIYNNQTGFVLERSTDNVSFGTVYSPVTYGSFFTYTDSTVSSGVTYYYRVYAYNTLGNSANSNTATVTMP